MRLRHILGIVVVVGLIGGGAWFFVNGTSSNALGPGGLPLIKADTNPVKLPPDDPGGEVMPNADSTVFPAISAEPDKDPSMQNLKMPPSAKTDPGADFAGLKTGFAVPAQPAKTTEELFDTAPKTAAPAPATPAPVPAAVPVPAPTPAPAASAGGYESGLASDDEMKSDDAPEAVPAPAPAPVVAPTPVTPAPVVKKAEAKPAPAPVVKKTETKPAPVVATKKDMPPAPSPIANDDSDNASQSMEEQEKAIVEPVVTPVVKTAAPSKPVATAKPAAKAPAQTVAEDVAKEAYKPAPAKAPAIKAAAPVKPGYYMQLASTPSSDEAPKLWTKLLGKYPAALSGLHPVYQTATVPGKGDYIRVQAGPVTQADATSRCKQLHAIDAKGGCLVFKR